MAVHVVAEEVTEQPRLRLVAPVDPPRADKDAVILRAQGVMYALALIVGPRLLLLLAGLGAFALGLIATLNPSIAGTAATGLFIAFVFLPLFALALKRSN